jgi:uncharacterized membrane protein YeaQ/YmgE (transglycosylase-associated protein family)
VARDQKHLFEIFFSLGYNFSERRNTMGIFTWIIVGAIAGWLASKIIKGHGSGLFLNIIIGVIGALLGGWLAGSIFGISDALTGFNLTTLLVAFGGSVLLLIILRLFRRK